MERFGLAPDLFPLPYSPKPVRKAVPEKPRKTSLTYDPSRYPKECAGSKAIGASEDAAAAVTPTIKEAHVKMLAAYTKYGPMTADEAGIKCGWPLHYRRPRCSELVKQGLLVNTKTRRASSNGSPATVWDVKPDGVVE